MGGRVYEIVSAGGWLMVPIIACSIVALAIILERLWSLRSGRVAPAGVVLHLLGLARQGALEPARLRQEAHASPLGRILVSGLINRHHPREVIRESIEESGRHVAHELERFMNTLGTIAAVTPLLGLLGTVFGMISVFTAINTHGVGDAGALAGGISEALITTAAGLSVAIPALMFYRYFRGRIDELILLMEQEAIRLVEILDGEREQEEQL
jgi:biopolymer transport protein ExbB